MTAPGDRASVRSGVASPPALLIEAGGPRSFGLRELLAYRELVLLLAWRDVRLRYKQTALGFLWAVLQPLLQAVAFTVIFRHASGVAPEGVSYGLFVFTGLVPWQLFSVATVRAGGCLVANQTLVTRVYFPRLALPIASIAMGLADFVITFVLLAGYLLVHGARPGFGLLALPFCIGGAAATALGAGLWLSALQVRYRDVTHVMSFLMQVWMLATPVVYATDPVISQDWRWVYALNPMVAVVEGFRAAVLGMPAPSATTVVAGAVSLFVLVVSGAFHFHGVERSLADEV